MESAQSKLKKLVGGSDKIFLTTHFSPDPDAICSLLLLGTTLKKNYPDKDILLAVEEPPAREISFLSSYDEIVFSDVYSQVLAFEPELLVVVDANNYQRVSRASAPQLRDFVASHNINTVIIDHHQPENKDDSDLYINDDSPATAEDVYRVLFEKLNLQKPDGFAQTTLLGIISDTFRFLYHNPHHRRTFSVVSDLLDAGASIEKLENKLGRYSKEQMAAFANLAKNITDSGRGYSYSYFDDEFSKNQFDNKANYETIKMGAELFTSQFVRNFESNDWGFIVYPEFINGEVSYCVSFRSVSGVTDVAKIASSLGGGGHKAAAGAKGIVGNNVSETITVIKEKIASIG